MSLPRFLTAFCFWIVNGIVNESPFIYYVAIIQNPTTVKFRILTRVVNEFKVIL